MWIVPLIIGGVVVWVISTQRSGNGNGNGNGDGAPEAGATTDAADGTYYEFPNRGWLVAFDGIWWRGGSGRACHQDASGLTVKQLDGTSYVCAQASSGMNVWRKVPTNTSMMLFDQGNGQTSGHTSGVASSNNYQSIKK